MELQHRWLSIIKSQGYMKSVISPPFCGNLSPFLTAHSAFAFMYLAVAVSDLLALLNSFYRKLSFLPIFSTSPSGIIQSFKIPSFRHLSLCFDERLLILDVLEQPLTGDTWWQSSSLPNTLSHSVHVQPKRFNNPALVTLNMTWFCSILPEQAVALKNKTWAKIHPEQWEIHCLLWTEQVLDNDAESTWTWGPKSRNI